MSWIGLDVGGANLKIAWPAEMKRNATEHSFRMWQAKDRLVEDLDRWLKQTSQDCGVAATMTGELADCFPNKAAGVVFIVDAICQAAGKRPVRFYRTDGTWCDSKAAIAQPHLVAASNWHALATYAARFLASGSGFLIDIGSTTTDIIPIVGQRPVVSCQTDYDRLRNGQLVYTGVGRSSLSGILSSVTIQDVEVNLANEHFATIQDAYLWLGMTPERPNGNNTADGRPATKANAGQRIARMACCDLDELGEQGVNQLAEAAAQANATLIEDAIKSVTACYHRATIPLHFIVSGSGSWLARRVLEGLFKTDLTSVTNLADEIGQEAAIAAPARAVAILAKETFASADVK